MNLFVRASPCLFISLLFTITAKTQNDALKIDSSGNIGIGTNKPLSLLDVNGTAQLRGAPNGTGLIIDRRGFAAIGTTAPPAAMLEVNGTALFRGKKNGSALTIDQNGNIGIGAPPYSNFSVAGSSFFLNHVAIGSPDTSQSLTIGHGGGLGFSGGNLNPVDKKLYSPTDGVLEWMTHNAAANHGFAISHQGDIKVYLNTKGDSYLIGGNLGIGTNRPNAALDVNGEINAKAVNGERPPKIYRIDAASHPNSWISTEIDLTELCADPDGCRLKIMTYKGSGQGIYEVGIITADIYIPEPSLTNPGPVLCVQSNINNMQTAIQAKDQKDYINWNDRIYLSNYPIDNNRRKNAGLYNGLKVQVSAQPARSAIIFIYDR